MTMNEMDRNRFASQYGSVPQNPGKAPGFFSQFASALGGAGTFSPLMNMLTGGVGALASTAVNFLGQRFQNKWQESMWSKQNEYNTPEAQIQRYLDAGINPAAAVESVLGGNGQQAGPVGSSSGPTGTGSLGDILGNSANSALNQQLLTAQIEKTNAEKDLVKSQDIGKKIENKYADAEHDAALKKMVDEGRITKSTANMIAQDEFYHGDEAFQHWQQTMLNTATMAQELQNLGQDYINKLAEYNVLMTQAGLNSAEIQKVWSDIGLNNAMIGKVNAETGNIKAETALTWQNVQMNDIRKEIDQITLAFKQNELKCLELYGYDPTKSTNNNYLMLAAQGKTEEANKLMGNVYDYSKGQYGARSEQTRRTISTATSAIAAVGGIIMMATGVGTIPGAALTSVGAAGLSRNTQVNYQYTDPNDYSHISN